MTDTIKKLNIPKLSGKADFKLYSKLLKMRKRPISTPGDYVFDINISDGALRFWTRLNTVSNCDGESWWKQKTMAKMFMLSEESIKRYIKELESAGLLEKKKRKNGRSNIYRLAWPIDCPDPRITGMKKNARIIAMQEKIDRQDGVPYRKSHGGFSKAFE